MSSHQDWVPHKGEELGQGVGEQGEIVDGEKDVYVVDYVGGEGG